MKKLLAILALLALIAGLFFLLRNRNPPAPSPIGQNETISSNPSNIPPVQSKTQNVPPVAIAPAQIASSQTELASRAASPNPTLETAAGTNEPPTLPLQIILDKTRVMIHNYHAAFGENPVGSNSEITAALQGNNPRKINFLAESGLRLNGKGELVDGYGTPLFFHQISGNEMEIRSAGPDKIMWTPDDSVTR